MSADINELRRRMEGALTALDKEFSGLRTGRASPNLLDSVQVDAYGSIMPLNQLGTVTVPEPRMLAVKVFDSGMIKAVEKGIVNAGLGLNPMSDGDLIRVSIPDLSEERRLELGKVARKYAEDAKVAVRNVRRDGNETLKAQEKAKEISEDDRKKQEADIQKLTDELVKKIDEQCAEKEKEILGQ